MNRALFLAGVASLVSSARALAVIFSSTGSPTFNTTAPSGVYADSGWQYEGTWQGLTGIPISPNYFVTAKHISVASMTFTFGGITYAVDDLDFAAGSDLAIGHIVGSFPSWAPLFLSGNETGKEMVVFGRGTQRGAEVTSGGNPRGWLWGAGDLTLRWGTNDVESIVNGGSGAGDLLVGDFDLNGSVNEGMLSLNDSGGGVFIKDTDGIWKLAGINFAVDGPYYTSVLGTGEFNAALFDESGFFVKNALNAFVPATGPGSFYATRVSSNLSFIQSITGVPEPGSALALALAGAMVLATRSRRP
jgi:hypothetical protein